MTLIVRQARIAGLLYLTSLFTAPFGFLYIPGKLIVSDNAAATADRIRASEWLLRLGIGTELVGQIIAVFVVLALYNLFKPVNAQRARLLVVLGALVSVPIVFMNVLNHVAALTLVGDAGFLSVFSRADRDALAYLFLRLHSAGLTVASVFWGLWLFPFGMLVIRSGFIPRVLGVLLMIAGAAYLATAFSTLVMPQYASIVRQLSFPFYFGEPPIIAWLVIWGAKPPPAVALVT